MARMPTRLLPGPHTDEPILWGPELWKASDPYLHMPGWNGGVEERRKRGGSGGEKEMRGGEGREEPQVCAEKLVPVDRGVSSLKLLR